MTYECWMKKKKNRNKNDKNSNVKEQTDGRLG